MDSEPRTTGGVANKAGGWSPPVQNPRLESKRIRLNDILPTNIKQYQKYIQKALLLPQR